MKKPFKFKERVIVSKEASWPNNKAPKNRKGRVWQRDDGDGFAVSVRLDENIGGHDIHTPGHDSGPGVHCKPGHGWNFPREDIRRIKNQK